MENKTMLYSLEGDWQADIGDGRLYTVHLPGTLDESQVGGRDESADQWHPDSGLGNTAGECREKGLITSRFTRKYTYEGQAVLRRSISYDVPQGKRIFLDVERARCLKLLVDEESVPDFRPPSISTPHVFELTKFWKGRHELSLLSDNSYPGLPHDAIVYSSAATDETQTNWNGVLGAFHLRTEESVFVDWIRIYPEGEHLTVKITLCADRLWSGQITVRSEALRRPEQHEVSLQNGTTEIVLEHLALAENVLRWDEYQGNLYELTVELSGGACKTAVFGVRDFGYDASGRLTLNGHRIFLRCEANCAEFPETGYCPMKVEEWLDILKTYQSYGINCVRFHSHCPPEAAFTAADQMGMLMQPELSHWNPRDAFESEESDSYYRTELEEILLTLANHPSFVMLTFGNELHASEKGHERMRELLALAHGTDATRLYANGSNTHYGNLGCDQNSDFYTSSNYYDQALRGTFANMGGFINHSYPGAMTDYDKSMKCLRKSYGKPVFSFEVGQFQVLPDFDELETFQGISDPANLRWIRNRVREFGLEPVWKKYVEATGELSRLCYREEIEAALRTEEMSGISLLGLQDFPGQGTALVGMLNSHLQPKPYKFAEPVAFRAFFAPRRPLVLLPRYTYENSEKLEAVVKMANFGKERIEGEFYCRLEGQESEILAEQKIPQTVCPPGVLTVAGKIEFALGMIERPSRLNLTVSVGAFSACYPVWVYPKTQPRCPKSVYETEHFDQKTKAVLEAGGTVYLTPPSEKEALPRSIQAQFSTDFWSVGTFSGQEGGMGQLIAEKHPVFRDFPTEFYTNWQWWPMATQRAVILPERYKAIITEMDSYAYLRPMAKLLECRCGNGRLLFSTMGLQNLQQYPEARALQASIYRYLESDAFLPDQEIEAEVIAQLVK